MDDQGLARLHGTVNAAGGLWPLLHMRSFEAVFGPKTDRWLVRTVSGLLLAIGLVQLGTRRDPHSIEQSRRIGLGTSSALAAVDITYAPGGRISRMYLADAAVQLGFICAWIRRRGSLEADSAGRRRPSGLRAARRGA
jgi:hypothetical protein